MDALYWAGRSTAIVFGLALFGCSFLLWGRSKGAAMMGALSGAGTVAFEIVFLVLGMIARSASVPTEQVQYLFAATNVLQSLACYLPLGAMAILLARSPR
jgi:hypothetical protein